MHLGLLSDPNHFHTRKWAKGLLNAGHKLTVFSFFEGQIPGATCVKISPPFTYKGRITYFSYFFAHQALLKALKKVDLDFLISIHVTPYGVWAARTGFRPLVHIAMGADILEYPPRLSQLDIPRERLYSSNSLHIPPPFHSTLWPMKWNIFRRNVAMALRKADFVLGDNRLLVDALHRWFQVPMNKIQLNRWGIERDLFEIEEKALSRLRSRWKIKAGRKVVLAPRGLKPVYQGDLILKAFEKILFQGENHLHFVMLSAGYQAPEEVDIRARKLDDHYDNFTYVQSLIPREEMGAVWSLTDAFVIAPVYDGYSNALSEGLYVGAIPFLSDIPAHREVIEEGVKARLLSPFSVGGLADELEQFKEEEGKWKAECSAHNREWIEKHAMLDNNIERFVEALEKIKMGSNS